MNSDIKEILKQINVDFAYIHYSGNATTYITYFFYDELDEEYSEDEVEVEGYYFQIDLYSMGDYIQLKKQIKSAFKNAGFSFDGGEDQEKDETGKYHVALRFSKAQYLF